jgi:hypothetical protein
MQSLYRSLFIWIPLLVNATEGQILFPKLRCLLAFRRLGFAIDNFEQYPVYFRDDSIVQLAQAGVYQGATDIEEYVKFAFSGYSPYLLNTSNPVSRQNTLNKVLGYRDGFCEFLEVLKFRALLNTSNNKDMPFFNYVTMVKLYLHLGTGYVSKVNVCFAPDFLRVVFDVAFNANNTRRFLCREVMSVACGHILNQTIASASPQCEAALQALPTTEGAWNHFDGNSSGCRVMHGVFAQNNPVHCPHLSFTPMLDPRVASSAKKVKRHCPRICLPNQTWKRSEPLLAGEALMQSLVTIPSYNVNDIL